jgi:hypothetical protein
MHVSKNDVPVKMAVPGATARQVVDFGDATDFGPIAGEYFSLAAGTDIAPLLQGLEADACQAPHWGYVIAGRVVVTYTNGTEEGCEGNDLFYWPPGHSVRVERDAEVILFSPQKEHCEVLDHMLAKISGG